MKSKLRSQGESWRTGCRHWVLRSLPALMLVMLCGCFQIKDELTIAPDGSGSVRMEVKTTAPEYMVQSAMGRDVIYPPTSESEAQRFFPAKDFTVKAEEQKGTENGTSVVIEAAFKDINALLASPYGKAHGLTLSVDKGVLQLKAISGMELPAIAAELKPERGMMPIPKANLKTNEMRFEFRVVLPNAVAASNGQKGDKGVSWVSERAKSKDTAEYAAQLSTIMEASCPADGIKFTPVTPLRMNMYAFKDLPVGTIQTSNSAPASEKVMQAAKFVPYALRVTRNLDISGEGGGRENQAELIGEVVIPNELAPQSWGAAELEDVIDSKGNSLKPKEQDMFRMMNPGRYVGDNFGEGKKAAPSNEQRREVRIAFQAPDWKVKEIASLKASMKLSYFTDKKLIAVSNAIPADWIMSMKKQRSFSGGQDHTIRHPQLTEAGLKISASGFAMDSYTTLSINVGDQKAGISEIAVFDATGKLVPTLEQNSNSEGGFHQLMMVGSVKTPLSVALLINGGGTEVDLPIVLEHVPVSGK